MRTPPRTRGGLGRLRPEGGGQKVARLGGYSEGLGCWRVSAGNAFWTPGLWGWGGEGVRKLAPPPRPCARAAPAPQGCSLPGPLSPPLPRPGGFYCVCFPGAPGDRARWSSFFLMAIGKLCKRVSFFKKKISAAAKNIQGKTRLSIRDGEGWRAKGCSS